MFIHQHLMQERVALALRPHRAQGDPPFTKMIRDGMDGSPLLRKVSK